MPVYVITSPDGQEFEITAPDGATQEQVLAYAQQNMPAKQPQADGFIDKTSADIEKRRAMGEKIQANPNISAPSKALQLFGNVGGGIVNDVVGNAVSSVGGAVDTTLDRPKPAGSVIPDIDPISAAYRGLKSNTKIK